MTKGWATAALAAVAALLVVAGLLISGGPDQARKERRDRQRLDDLVALEALVECLANANRGQLPDQLAPSAQCSWSAALDDPFTGQPYRYAPTGLRSYRLCAGFETPPPNRERFGPFMRDDEGCIGRLYVPAR